MSQIQKYCVYLGLCIFSLLLFAKTCPAAQTQDLARQWLVYGNALYMKNDAAGALAAYDKGLGFDAQNANLWQAKGNALLKSGQRTQAFDAYQRSLQINPNNTLLKDYLARAQASSPAMPVDAEKLAEQREEAGQLLAGQKYAEAQALYEGILKADAKDAQSLAGLADALYAQGQSQAARATYQQSLAQDPEQARIKALLENHLPADVENKAREVAGQPKDWVSPLWRSALLPGWGQAHNGQKSKAWGMAALTLGTLAGAVGTYIAADGAYKTYSALGASNTEAEFGSAWNQVEGMATANHILVVLFYSAYAFNLGDAIAHAKPRVVTFSMDLNRQGSTLARMDLRF